MKRKTDWKELSRQIRQDILNISFKAQVGHVGSAFSIVEILIALYYRVLNIAKIKKGSTLRDKFILSKGHAAPALYSILFRREIINKKTYLSYCQNGGSLEEHPTYGIKGIEAGTGSLGHGLPIGIGMALAARIQKTKNRIFVLLSDAECDEGETWEGALFAGHHHLNNLYCLLDYNKVQALGKTKEILDLEPLKSKWQSFNWRVLEVDGHNIESIIEACMSATISKPTCIICHTVRGKGVSFMEHKIDWHYLTPTKEHVEKALKELNK
ncbi:hypothetical protein A2773_04940 [Candidatus Gottesmanbacteria bacterium RIFCSPHIGHO2_01_FULL_39_10]|uniref:Transketolase N-terminal domain-containing protein n=1 Tax=Candidatus Gottesmanbacteria bacterium RIFCSPHIGHO2_01_FULL_39_10 TaxID=1798375 RepID=A0A1F5ZS08_9BACT|nr:MAG: hypothetical protein A2773_04940 [Candidatus Gottesmanbacteria bacterium RIFCSPHIGHO2_01_FULL_39_10]